DLNIIYAVTEEEEADVSGDEECKEDAPTDNPPGDDVWRLERRMRSSKTNIPPDVPPALHSPDLSSDPPTQVQSQNIPKKNPYRRRVRRRRDPNKPKPFACSECNKCYTSKASLYIHKKEHTGKPYPCPECEKAFNRMVELIIHQRSHTGERPFPCSECNKCFTSQS
ncbi:hypothetical protein GDO81_018829, partial [Engystomops pustulosus]